MLLETKSITDLQVKTDVRRLKGIPALVSMLDHPNREVSVYLNILYPGSVVVQVYDRVKTESL